MNTVAVPREALERWKEELWKNAFVGDADEEDNNYEIQAIIREIENLLKSHDMNGEKS